MKIHCDWKEKLRFTGVADQHSIEMDTKPPLGSDVAPSPKQLLLSAICGCTGMDVVALLRKYRQPLESFRIEADASLTESGHPVTFKDVKLVFQLKGALEPAKVMEAITLSQTQYCSVSAMVSKALPISYTVELNGQNIGSGKAEFKSAQEG